MGGASVRRAVERDDARQPPPVQADEGEAEREDRRAAAVEQRLRATCGWIATGRLGGGGERPAVEDASRRSRCGRWNRVGGVLGPLPEPRARR